MISFQNQNAYLECIYITCHLSQRSFCAKFMGINFSREVKNGKFLLWLNQNLYTNYKIKQLVDTPTQVVVVA